MLVAGSLRREPRQGNGAPDEVHRAPKAIGVVGEREDGQAGGGGEAERVGTRCLETGTTPVFRAMVNRRDVKRNPPLSAGICNGNPRYRPEIATIAATPDSTWNIRLRR